MCGGTADSSHESRRRIGLSPRVRGNRPGSPSGDANCRSIPACAGEPRRAQSVPALPAVYPRVCGGTPRPSRDQPSTKGLSPRVRGNLGAPKRAPRGDGSIPACAGEPPLSAAARPDVRVYPRVCGGTSPACPRAGQGMGLSPRVRGNLGLSSQTWPPLRSIPACAGEPALPITSELVQGVYPRVCGGTRLPEG